MQLRATMPAKERQIRYDTSMKSRSKRNRKRPRGGIGCLVGDGESDDDSDEKSPSSSSLLRTEVVPLSRAFEIIIAGASRDEERREITCTNKNIVEHERRVRIIYPYPFTFATFAKARWVGKTVADIYHEEFGEERIYFVQLVYWFSTNLILSDRQLPKKLLRSCNQSRKNPSLGEEGKL